MRTPNNPMRIKIELAETREMLRELARCLLCVLVALALVWGFFQVFAPGEIMTGTIVEDNRGPELKKLYEEAMR